MAQQQVIDTRFRSALARLAKADRILTFEKGADPHLEIAAILKKHDGNRTLLFPDVKGYDIPLVGNLLSSKENCEAAFDLDFKGIRELVQRAMSGPLLPELVSAAPSQEIVLKLASTSPSSFRHSFMRLVTPVVT